MKCSHTWVPRTRGVGEHCKSCGDRFPCDERDCGHGDCIEFRVSTSSLPICTHCRRKVDLNKGPIVLFDTNNHEKLRYYVTSVRGRSKIVCETCLDQQSQETNADSQV